MRTKKPMAPWVTYETAMRSARAAAFALADAISPRREPHVVAASLPR